ncbi:DUF488 domain-containing protein [Alicyclobacillus sp. ALC3]|uniref:DUF488 domain-containing protein n=1 Tax=Alicyclobacillus sp. ALC3 TaxID=2796143 RepID=UPI0023790164|nr:DUF488 family protein [Alicyclobacillus sp. ALC3]WDL97558.1 DUF488 family protein [Alicyclobacillus sp. ALC3]
MSSEHKLQLKRVYEPWCESDGKRVLIDRIWPRGVSKGNAKVDIWLKQIAPSQDLRAWFSHDPERFDAFRSAYQMELSSQEEKRTAVETVLGELCEGDVTLLYGAKDSVHNHAVVLYNYLQTRR